ncbi:MAG: alpha/beta hydrolase [Gammaproteobacteria bacterium]
MQQQRESNPGDTTLFAPEHKSVRGVFVHGLFLRGYEVAWLAHYLRHDGIKLERFRYSSRKESPAKVAARLAEDLRKAPDAHIIAHSLGGLIALAALAEVQSCWQGRAVLLGPPLAGSGCARRTAELWGGKWLLGAAREWLFNGLPSMQLPSYRVAVIAGTFNHGMGTLLHACPAPGDGVVSVAETRLEGAVHLPLVNTTHLGLLFSRDAAEAAAGFIRPGAAAVRR